MRYGIPEIVVPGKRLGRAVNHDPQSRLYRVPERDATAFASVRHLRRVPVLDQGNVGSCTGNAAVGALGTDPIYSTMPAGTVLDEHEAVDLYSSATQIDTYPGGYYAPDWQDTGSDGLSVAKACVKAGLASGYTHAFSLTAALTALQVGPIMCGTDWLTGMDSPDHAGFIHVTGSLRGGHEYVVDEVDVTRQLVGMTNSWGESWGNRGRAYISWADLQLLLDRSGDVTVLVPLSAPAPIPTPTPSDADTALWETNRAWRAARHIGSNAAAVRAEAAWGKAKGYS